MRAIRNLKAGERVVVTDDPVITLRWPTWTPHHEALKGSTLTVESVERNYVMLNTPRGSMGFSKRWLSRPVVDKSKKSTGRIPTKVKKSNLPKIGIHTILGQPKAKKHLGVAIKHNLPVLLVGDTGTGKTTIIKDIADGRKQTVLRFSITGETTVDEFVGKYVLEAGETKWQDGILLYAMKAGHWLVVDEVNVALPEILFVLHSLLDDDKQVLVTQHDGEIIKPHAEFRFFGTMNPVDEYAGTKDLNKAFKSRFGMILELKYPPAKIERQIVELKGETTPEMAALLVDIGLAIRKAKANDEVFFTCSTRDLIQTAKLVEPLGIDDALTVGIVNKGNGDEKKLREIIAKLVSGYEEAIAENITLNIEMAITLNKAKEQLIAQQKDIEKKIRAEILAELKAKKKGTTKKTTKKRLSLAEKLKL